MDTDTLPPAYQQFYRDVRRELPQTPIILDPLRTLALGTDASFYRLIPKMVIQADSETAVAVILQTANRHKVSVTFRAAGTSLSGQAVTDSVLVVAGAQWKQYEILEDGDKIRLQPGIVGAQANAYLASYGRKIGPDPASINAAMIGGIAANNASGMCCGTAQNSYQTLSSMRIILHDGTLLDTGETQSKERFRQSHGALLEAINALAERVRQDEALAGRIRHKFKIKNTTGYSLNALIDFEDPFDILAHLMIGSEGTLGFISEIVYATVEEHPFKASALMIFSDMRAACQSTAILKRQPVAAVELMDRASLRAVEKKPNMPAFLKTLSSSATALLVETRASDSEQLQQNIQAIEASLKEMPLERPIAFTDKVDEFTALWNIRKGLFPAVGAVREIGTTVIIEDVAFPIDKLADATLELQELMARYAYDEAIIFGHALEGNLHFVFTQDFSTSDQVERYRRFMHDVCTMVVDHYDGSLKAEHGTGRNMAPYVEMEWGSAAYQLMQEIKSLLDPHNLLNPGVILNANPRIHVENLKPLPQTHTLVDTCIECGFCEDVCPSKNLTLTPRQRIVAQREISRLKRTDSHPERLARLTESYLYQGEQTCAADGLCEMACPVDINTGDLTKALRQIELEGSPKVWPAWWIARHLGQTTQVARYGLKLAQAVHTLIGTPRMERLMQQLRDLSRKRLPLWNRYMPGAAGAFSPISNGAAEEPKVVYFPSCVARTMGPAQGDPDQRSLPEITLRLLRKAGYGVIFPEKMEMLCCGMPFSSKGYVEQGDAKAKELEKALLTASRNGQYPVLCDTSPCLHLMRQKMDARLKLFEPVEFAHDYLMQKLRFTQQAETAAIHITCSAMKMGLSDKFIALARACVKDVVVPEGIGCCGFAGDRGFTFPELNASALADLKQAVAKRCTTGYSNSRTCEIGLSLHSGIHYKSILYLVDQCTQAPARHHSQN